ncbi:MAG: hypothetical protein ACXVGE_23440 [Blastococcus sp.]
MTDHAFWAPPAVPRPAGSRGRLLAAAAVALVLVVGVVVLVLASQGGRATEPLVAGVELSRPLVLADLQGVLTTPEGYQRLDASPGESASFCTDELVSAAATPADSAFLGASVGGQEEAPRSVQEIQLFASHAAAVAHVRAVTAGIPCQPHDGSMRADIRRRSCQGCFVTTLGPRSSGATILVDVVAIGNAVLLNTDVTALVPPPVRAHDARREAVVRELHRRAGGAQARPSPTG